MSDVHRTLVVDTSVLLNFIAVGRLDLLAALPGTTTVVTDHVRDEITDDHPDQIAIFDSAVYDSLFSPIRVDKPDELITFARLESSGLGTGERSAIATAFHRGFVVGLDDRRAIAILSRIFGNIRVLRTQDIVRELIHARVLTVTEADAMKHRWQEFHRFTLPFESFGDPP
jgi:hypothetical protein